MNAPFTFEQVIAESFVGLYFLSVSLAKLVIFLKSIGKHLNHPGVALKTVTNDDYKGRLSKCLFAQRCVSYRGSIMLRKRVIVDPIKVDATAKLKKPNNKAHLRSLMISLGFTVD